MAHPMYKFVSLSLMAVLLFCSCSKEAVITTETTCNLIAYYPDSLCRWDLVTKDLPDCADEEIIFCGSAAFTGKCMEQFSHLNIMGPHISAGDTLHNGYNYNKNYGIFTYYDHVGKFSTLPNKALLDTVVSHGGMAFTQHWVIRNGERWQPVTFGLERKNYYRVLAEKDGRLCIIDSRKSIRYGLFLEALEAYGVQNAITMDMGGWNYSFWRDDSGHLHIIHRNPNKYATNWLVIKGTPSCTFIPNFKKIGTIFW